MDFNAIFGIIIIAVGFGIMAYLVCRSRSIIARIEAESLRTAREIMGSLYNAG